jgi:hypothetical protein
LTRGNHRIDPVTVSAAMHRGEGCWTREPHTLTKRRTKELYERSVSKCRRQVKPGVLNMHTFPTADSPTSYISTRIQGRREIADIPRSTSLNCAKRALLALAPGGPLAAMLCEVRSGYGRLRWLIGGLFNSCLKERRLIDNGERRAGEQL